MMHEHGKSDSAIVAAKPTNKAGRPAAEPVERRAGTEGNAGQHSTRRHSTGKACPKRWATYGKSLSERFAVKHPSEPYAGNPHVRICAGGVQ